MASKPLIVHVVPVVSGVTNEPGWLVLSGKKDGRVARLLPLIAAELRSWEPRVKSWFVHADRGGDALEAIELAVAPRRVAFCQPCATGRPCARWKKIAAHGYRLRDPDDASHAPPAVAEPAPEPSGATAIPHPLPGFDVDFWARFLDDLFRAKGRRRQEPDDPTAFGPATAAAVLGVPWPGADKTAVVAAYRKAALSAHPDHGGSDAAMARVNAARDTLMAAIAAIA